MELFVNLEPGGWKVCNEKENQEHNNPLSKRQNEVH